MRDGAAGGARRDDMPARVKTARRFIVGANWKCHGRTTSARAYAKALGDAALPRDVDVYIAPSLLHLHALRDGMPEEVEIAAQNFWDGGDGAYTGETSCDMLREAGATRVIVGHSERRTLFGETDDDVRMKACRALEDGLSVSLCVGENAGVRSEGGAVEFCIKQLEAVMPYVPESKWRYVVVVYEPLWAIGTGIAAEPKKVQEMHAAIRDWFAARTSVARAAKMRITYGGSVNEQNCQSLAQLEDVDGFLVGNASLSASSFIGICQGSSVAARKCAAA